MTRKAKPGYKLELSNFKKYEEIPKDWSLKTLDKVGKIVGGGTPKTTVPEYWDGDILWATPSDLTGIEGNYIDDTERKITQKGLDESSAKPIDPGNIIFSSRATVAECKINTKPIATNQGFQNIIPKKEHDKMFVFYAVLQNKIKFLRFAYGTTFLEIGKNNVKKVKIPFPKTLDEEIKIGVVLFHLDKLIQSYQKTIETTTKLKKGLMQQLLTRGIGHKKFKKVPWLFGKEIEIPEEWELEKLGENSTLKGRIGWQGLTTKEYREKGEFYLVTGTDFKKGKIDWENCVFVDKDRFDQDLNIQLKNDDVLITKDGTIGKIAVVDKHLFPATLNTGVFVVRPIEKKYLPLILYYILNSNYFLKFLNRFKGGSTINHLYQKDFVKFSFPIPSLSEQKKIASMLSSVDEKIIKLESKKKSLESLKKGLMQKLLTGEIRVAA